jgi:hypothetical protein
MMKKGGKDRTAGLSLAVPDTVEPKSYSKTFHLSEGFRIPEDKFHDMRPFHDIFPGKRPLFFQIPLVGRRGTPFA